MTAEYTIILQQLINAGTQSCSQSSLLKFLKRRGTVYTSPVGDAWRARNLDVARASLQDLNLF